jgi:hypothetical protein
LPRIRITNCGDLQPDLHAAVACIALPHNQLRTGKNPLAQRHGRTSAPARILHS